VNRQSKTLQEELCMKMRQAFYHPDFRTLPKEEGVVCYGEFPPDMKWSVSYFTPRGLWYGSTHNLTKQEAQKIVRAFRLKQRLKKAQAKL